jgi:2-(1,2-epoxy-1,2-dihydrophenyl)acetyl-CoA isomerase
MSNSDCVLTDINQSVLSITLNRPKANAFNEEMAKKLQAALKEAAVNTHIRCVLLTAKGKMFSAGQDVSVAVSAEGFSYRQHLVNTYNPIILQIRKLEKPVVAAINGSVAGAALGIILACDIRIAADDSRFVVGFSGIGLSPDSAVSLLLPSIIGLGRATEYAFTNQPISAQQAFEWGLINRIVASDQLHSQATAWAASIAAGPVNAMGLAKRNFNKSILPNLEQVLDYEAHIQEIAGKSDEHREGLQAFIEKRTPRFLNV